ncbi:GIY-YIG nuclease family protein [soil metagenome]
MDPIKYFTYIVQCVDGSYYIGMTKDVWKRLHMHNGKLAGGAKYTRNKRPVVLRYYESHLTFRDAAQRERALKKFSRAAKSKLCDGFTCLL